MRAREAARKLCTSEAELVACACGTSAVRLDPHFGALVTGLSGPRPMRWTWAPSAAETPRFV